MFDNGILSLYSAYMGLTDRAIDVLRHSESELRLLTGEAAQAGDYDAVVCLARWASELSSLIASCGEGARTIDASSQPPIAFVPDRRVGSGKRSRAPVMPQAQRTRSNSSASQRRAKYPRFVRFNGELVKIGWSKRSSQEYEHKAPRRAVDALTSAICVLRPDGRIIKTDDLLPIEDGAADSEFPAYQVYVCLAWLREEGLVQQHGRQGYTVPDPGGLQSAVEERWKRLPAR